MAKKNISETSKEAFMKLNPVRVHQTHIEITKALEAIGSGNYEKIALQMNCPEQRVWKRLKECCGLGLIHNTGTKMLTKNGYNSFIYAPGKGAEVFKRERIMKGKTVADYSRALNQPKQSIHIQESLF